MAGMRAAMVGKMRPRGGVRRRRRSMMPHVPAIGTSTPHPPMTPSDSMLDPSEHPPMPNLGGGPPSGGYFSGGGGQTGGGL